MRRVIFRIARGRSGASLGCAVIASRAIDAGRPVMVADGDVNNPTLSRLYPPTAPYGAPRPVDAELETSRTWLADTLAIALERDASLIVDMGGGDRIAEQLAAESHFGDFLASSGVGCTYTYYTGPERDDFDHVYRIWSSGAFEGGDNILFLNAGLARNQGRSSDPFSWLRDDKRFHEMESSGVVAVSMPALTCMRHIEEEGMSVFDALDGLKTPSGRPLNPLWSHMANRWYADFCQSIEEEGADKWLA